LLHFNSRPQRPPPQSPITRHLQTSNSTDRPASLTCRRLHPYPTSPHVRRAAEPLRYHHDIHPLSTIGKTSSAEKLGSNRSPHTHTPTHPPLPYPIVPCSVFARCPAGPRSAAKRAQVRQVPQTPGRGACPANPILTIVSPDGRAVPDQPRRGQHTSTWTQSLRRNRKRIRYVMPLDQNLGSTAKQVRETLSTTGNNLRGQMEKRHWKQDAEQDRVGAVPCLACCRGLGIVTNLIPLAAPPSVSSLLSVPCFLIPFSRFSLA
jgi:hypothetical protein